MVIGETEFVGTRAQREPILQEILEGYVSRRIDQLRERLPLEIFSSSLDELPLPERRNRFVNGLNLLEDGLLAGGCKPYEFLRLGCRQAVLPVWYMIYPNESKPYKMRVINEVPKDLVQKAQEVMISNPHYNEVYHPDYPQNRGIKLVSWDGLAEPAIFRKHFTAVRIFLDGMHEYLRSYASH